MIVLKRLFFCIKLQILPNICTLGYLKDSNAAAHSVDSDNFKQ